jgi:hypothetical protein
MMWTLMEVTATTTEKTYARRLRNGLGGGWEAVKIIRLTKSIYGNHLQKSINGGVPPKTPSIFRGGSLIRFALG